MAKSKASKEVVLEKVQDEAVELVEDKATETITKEEEKLIQIARANKKREQEAQEAILGVLKEFRVDLVVNMNSPLAKPTIKLVLLQ